MLKNVYLSTAMRCRNCLFVESWFTSSRLDYTFRVDAMVESGESGGYPRVVEQLSLDGGMCKTFSFRKGCFLLVMETDSPKQSSVDFSKPNLNP